MDLFSCHSQQPLHPAAPWDGSQVPLQHGKIAVVTGANSGIGFVTARTLALRGAFVVLACRSEERGLWAMQEITRQLTEASGKGHVVFLQLDLARLASVREFVDAVRQRGIQRLDLLINNAGLACPTQTTTPDGFETQFQVNHLGHFLLTALLLPLLQASAAARIVNVSSNTHRTANGMHFETLAEGTDEPFTRYSRSKLANLLFTFELRERLGKAGVSSVMTVAAHPGMTYTDMGDKSVEGSLPEFLWDFGKWVLTKIPSQETEKGALPTLYAATMDDVASGDYYGPHGFMNLRGYPAKEIPDAAAESRDDRTTLWELSEQLTATPFVVGAMDGREDAPPNARSTNVVCMVTVVM